MAQPVFRAFEFGEMTFSKEDLRRLPEPYYRFLVAGSVACNDVAIFMRLLIQASHDKAGSEVLNTLIQVNYTVLLRTWVSKLYEFDALVEVFSKQVERASAKRPLPNADRILRRARRLNGCIRKSPAYANAKLIRDKLMHHYFGSGDIELLDGHPDNEVFRVLSHRNVGNSVSPLGEVIALLGALNKNATAKKAVFDELVEWSLAACRFLTRFHQLFLIAIMREYFPDRPYRKLKVAAPLAMVGTSDNYSPILIEGR